MRAGIRSRPWLGLDLGSFSVKLVASQGGPRQRLRFEETRLPENANGRTTPDQVARTVADCLNKVGLTPRGVRGITVGISGPDVFIKQIALPIMDDAEVASALRFESRKHLPFDPEGMVIDYQVLQRSVSDKKIEVLLCAVSRAHLQDHLQPLRLLGVEADIVDATPLALTNALLHGSDPGTEVHVLLDVGHSSSHLAIYRRGTPFFARRLEFGGVSLTRAIAEETGVSTEEAEEFKLAVGSSQSALRVDWNTREMAAMSRTLRSELGSELGRSFAFYRTLGDLPDDLQMWVSGGSARIPGLAAHLSEILNLRVMVFNPVSGAGEDRRATLPQLVQAFGLALRSA